MSFVVPVRNGADLIEHTLTTILAQADGRPLEIIVVDDGSTDESVRIVERVAASHPIRMIRRDGSGAAAAINAGIVAAKYPIVCQVDQDVRLEPGWMQTLVSALADPNVAAAQGYYATDRRASLVARVMSLDLEQRYASIGEETDHVCTGNSAYKTEAIRGVGLFDERLGYGYDNDMSYRLRAAGYRLAFCRAARSVHLWREGLAEYLRQQYGFGYGRIDLVAKHPNRVRGDHVSPGLMMLHPVVMLVALSLCVASTITFQLAPGASHGFVLAGMTLLGALAFERAWSGVRAWKQFGDRAALLFPVLHLARDFAWVAGILVWSTRRIRGTGSKPCDSMRPREPAASQD